MVTRRDVYKRLADPYYQIVDVRSRAEYLGEEGTKGLEGNPLKLGHIPGAYNINYQKAWVDTESKRIKTYGALQDLYSGLDPRRCVVVYSNSGRRSSFSYFILRLMGFPDVRTYEASWKEWGLPGKFLPVQLSENPLEGARPQASSGTVDEQQPQQPAKRSGEPAGGYVSCGG